MATKHPIGEQLRQAVLRCGKSRYRVSLESGISQAVLSRFVRGETSLSLANADKLCESLDAELVLKPKGTKRTKKR